MPKRNEPLSNNENPVSGLKSLQDCENLFFFGFSFNDPLSILHSLVVLMMCNFVLSETYVRKAHFLQMIADIPYHLTDPPH